MAQSLRVFQPKYYARFQCIGPNCEDTCCAGAAVVIDKDTYGKYKACGDSEIAPIVAAYMASNPASKSDNTFAFINVPLNSACPFLTQERLCLIQKKLGEGFLSRTCATYPRAVSIVDGITERSLYLSCPEAARLALLAPEPMQFEEIEAEPDLRFGGFPEINTGSEDETGKPYRHFHEIRRFVIALLQNRDYALWKRLVILGMFCDQLQRIAEGNAAGDVAELIQSFTEHIAAGGFEETLENIAIQPGLQANFLIQAMDYRIGLGSIGQRFLDCLSDCVEGIDYTRDAPAGEIAERYQAAYTRYYAPFLDRHEYMLEHFLVNAVFKSLFPFGPQRGTYLESRTIFGEFLNLAIQYALLRSLLVGMAGTYKGDLGPDNALKLIQSFAKAIEHNPAYLKRVAESLAENNMADLAVLAFLIKN